MIEKKDSGQKLIKSGGGTPPGGFIKIKMKKDRRSPTS